MKEVETVWSDENRKIAEENRVLRNDLSLLQQNASPKSAKLMGELLMWVDSMASSLQCNTYATHPEPTLQNVSEEEKSTTFRPISPAFNGPGPNVTIPKIIVTQSQAKEPEPESDQLSVSQNIQASRAKYPVHGYHKPKLFIPYNSKSLEIPREMPQWDSSVNIFTSKVYPQQSPTMFHSELHQRDLSITNEKSPKYTTERDRSLSTKYTTERDRSLSTKYTTERDRSLSTKYTTERDRSLVSERNRSPTPEQKAVLETKTSPDSIQDRIRRSGAELEDEWESIHPRITDIHQRRVRGNFDAVVPQRDISPERYWRYTGVSSGRDVVGDPVATSTPKIRGHVWEPLATSTPKPHYERLLDSIIKKVSRPIDQLTGVDPTMTRDRWLNVVMISKNKRLVGEITFQMDRRIIEYIFAGYTTHKCLKKRRYYGFNIANIGDLIRRETVTVLPDGSQDPRKELNIHKRFENVVRTLAKLGYDLDKHEEFLQDMVNKYGLLSDPPSRKMVMELGLNDPMVLREVFSQLIQDEKELRNVLLLLDCLCLLAYEDGRPLFLW